MRQPRQLSEAVNRDPGGTDDALQTLGPFDGVWGHPAVFGGKGGWVYVLESSGGGYLRARATESTVKGYHNSPRQATSTQTFGYTSGSPVVTSNGTKAGSAVVWAVYVRNAKGDDAQLQAYKAIPVGGTLKLLWSSPIGIGSKIHYSDQLRRHGLRREQVGPDNGVRHQVERALLGHTGELRKRGGRDEQDRGRHGDRTQSMTVSASVSGDWCARGRGWRQVPTRQLTGPGVEGSTGVAGTEPIEGSNQPFSVSAPSGPVPSPAAGHANSTSRTRRIRRVKWSRR